MFFVNQIPHLKVIQQKAILPYDEKNHLSNSIAFVNGNDVKSTINLINNDYLFHGNKYHYYYLDFTFTGKFFNRPYRINNRKERDIVYEEFERNIKQIKPTSIFDNIDGRNVYFDLFKYNQIFLNYAKKSKIKDRVINYCNFINSFINQERFSTYKIKTIYIDIESWLKSTKDLKGSINYYNNPVLFMYYGMYKMLSKVKELGNVDFIFYAGNKILRLNPSLCNENSFTDFKRELTKVSNNIKLTIDENEFDKEMAKQELKDSVINNFSQYYNFYGEDGDIDDEEFQTKIIDKVDEIIDNENGDSSNKDLQEKIENELINNADLAKAVVVYTQAKKTGTTTLSNKRDEELKEKQKNLKLGRMTIEEAKEIISNNIKIPEIEISDKVKTINSNVTKVKFPNFEKAYNEHLFHKDIVNNLTYMNELPIPVYVRNIKVDDSSDELNFKETYTVDLEDSNRVRHTLKFDIPKFIDDKFMYLRGNKKIIIKQRYMKPIVKLGPDAVQIVSNYNKIFVRRYGKKISSKVEKFIKSINAQITGIDVKYGNNLVTNMKYKSILEYDEISKDITYIKIGDFEFYFNREEMDALLKEKGIKLKENELCFGFANTKGNLNEPLIIDINTQKMVNGEMDIVDFIISSASNKLGQDFDDAKSGKKFMYTRAKIMKKEVPIILLLSYFEGLSTILRKANINHHFSDVKPNNIPNNQGVVAFENGYLIYDKYPFENSLLMNAFVDIPTKAFNYEDFDEKDVYLSIFDSLFGTKLIGQLFDNFYDSMIDPITKEILDDLNYPTDLVGVLLTANSLLSDNSYAKEIDMNLFRVRSNELVNAYLYKAISTAYARYKITSNNNNPVKISIPQDIVIKELMMSQNVEDYSTLNPIVELEKSRAITPKGLSGLNLDQAFTQDKRSYDKTMLGLMALSTSPDANCGIVRQLTLEPNIINARGYMNITPKEKVDSLNDANLFSPAELLSPLGNSRDDSVRTAIRELSHYVVIHNSNLF